MFVYRIVKSPIRANDLSGTGAFRAGGRWNNKGTYMLYGSENSSLAYLETLVHFNVSEFAPHLYLIQIEIENDAPVWELPLNNYPDDWKEIGQTACKAIGDQLMNDQKYLAIKVRSAVNYLEFNYLLNPLFPRFHDMVQVKMVNLIEIDERLIL